MTLTWPEPAMVFSLRPKNINFDKMWRELKPSILNVVTLQPITNKQWNYKFGDIYDICVAIPEPLSSTLYDAVKACLVEHTTSQYETLKETPTESLLSEYYRMWQVYYSGSGYLHTLFSYLNRQFVRARKSTQQPDTEQYSFSQYIHADSVKEIGSLALEMWRLNVLEMLKDNLITLVLNALQQDRNGNQIDKQNIIAGVIQSFVLVQQQFSVEERPGGIPDYRHPEPSVAYYKMNFEESFLKDTRSFYGVMANSLLEKYDVSKYMKAVTEKLDDEEKRTKLFCPPCTLAPAMKLCREVFIDAHKDKLYAEARTYITEEKTNDLRNMYGLLKPLSGGLGPVVAEFERHVKEKGLDSIATLSGENVPTQFVQNILAVYDKYSAMKTEVFMEDGDFSGALDKALQVVVNTRDKNEPRALPKASERLSRFIDQLLRKSVKGLTETEIESFLTKAIIIFRYIEDKDVFQKYYTKMLSNRLIHGVSVSMDAEEAMITKLKQACGYEFTAKLSRMYTDIGLSQDLQSRFQSWCADQNVDAGPSMTPFILQAGAWPLSAAPLGASSSGRNSGRGSDDSLSSASSFQLPSELLRCVENFQKFYVGAHNGRKLTWLYHMSTSEVKLCYLDKTYIVLMTVHQMALVFCFSQVDSSTVADLGEKTGLSGELLFKGVRSLIDAGLLVHDKKEGEDDQMTAAAKVSLNMKLTSKRIRFKIPPPQMNRAAEKEMEQVNVTAQSDRKYYMECAIVRIMKTRKVLKHSSLIQEVIEQTRNRFQPDVPFIKKSIEELIDKMYIQRTDVNDEYQYLA